MNGYMAEAQKGFATLEDVDYGTFVRFIEWAHRGYYTAAKFKTVETESRCTSKSQNHDEFVSAPKEDYRDEPPPEHRVEYVEEEAAAVVPSKERRKGKKGIHKGWEVEDDYDQWGMSRNRTPLAIKAELKDAFLGRRYTVRQRIPRPQTNQDPEEDYTDVFLSHAQLHVFADMYLIQSLKVLALEELHATLAVYTLHPVRTGDIIALLRYVYGDTGVPNESKEELQKLLTAYIGCEMETLMENEDFRDLMFEVREPLFGDFWTMVQRRIS